MSSPLRDIAARLTAAGIPDAQSDARRLLAHAVGIEPGTASLWRGVLDDAQTETLENAIAARLTRQPISQITGWRDFWKHRFRVTRDTLDPRPETETLVAEALKLPWRSVLDLGTGTGAILLSVMADRPGSTGWGVDLSEAALDVARLNAAALGLRPDFAVSNWFSDVEGEFDLIVSNPPYIAADEMADLAPEVREWEPRSALTDEGDGLAAYRAISGGAAAHLTPGGWLLVEIGPTQGAEVCELFSAAGFESVAVRSDLDGRDRVVVGRKPDATDEVSVN